MIFPRLLRYAEILGIIAWTVLIILQLVFEIDRYLFLLVYVLHFITAAGTMQFVNEQVKTIGSWFFLAMVGVGLVADAASLAEHIVDCEHHGFTALRIAQIVLWCWAVAMDIMYIIWCSIVFFSSPQIQKRQRLRV